MERVRVDSITDYFALGKIIREGKELPGQIHISNITNGYVKNINEHLKEGQVVDVKIIKYNQRRKVWELACI